MIQVTAAIMVDSGRVFIAKRKLSDRLSGRWEFPGGKLEDGETPEECLKRELREEFEIDVMVGQIVGISKYDYEFGTIELLGYRAQIIGGDIRLNDHDEVAWAAPEDLDKYAFASADIPFAEMIRRGDIAL